MKDLQSALQDMTNDNDAREYLGQVISFYAAAKKNAKNPQQLEKPIRLMLILNIIAKLNQIKKENKSLHFRLNKYFIQLYRLISLIVAEEIQWTHWVKTSSTGKETKPFGMDKVKTYEQVERIHAAVLFLKQHFYAEEVIEQKLDFYQKELEESVYVIGLSYFDMVALKNVDILLQRKPSDALDYLTTIHAAQLKKIQDRDAAIANRRKELYEAKLYLSAKLLQIAMIATPNAPPLLASNSMFTLSKMFLPTSIHQNMGWFFQSMGLVLGCLYVSYTGLWLNLGLMALSCSAKLLYSLMSKPKFNDATASIIQPSAQLQSEQSGALYVFMLMMGILGNRIWNNMTYKWGLQEDLANYFKSCNEQNTSGVKPLQTPLQLKWNSGLFSSEQEVLEEQFRNCEQNLISDVQVKTHALFNNPLSLFKERNPVDIKWSGSNGEDYVATCDLSSGYDTLLNRNINVLNCDNVVQLYP